MANYSTYFAIEKKFKRIGVTIERDEMIHDFSNGKKDSLKALSDSEYQDFIRYLNQFFKSQVNIQSETKQKRKIIALFAQMGYLTDDNKADMQRINNWCIQYGHLHCNLNGYKGSDLVKLVTQAEEVYNTFIRDVCR